MWKLTEKGQIFERKIEAEKVRLEKIQEAAARRGGENPFVALCNSRMFDVQMDSAATAASLDADNYLQRDIDSLCGATLLSIRSNVRQNPYVATICSFHQLLTGRQKCARMQRNGTG